VTTDRLEDPYEPSGGPDAARGRVMPPAIILIILNVLSLLIGLGTAGYGVYITVIGPDEWRRQNLENLNAWPGMRDMAEKQDKQATYYTGIAENLGLGILWLLLSILALIGAIRMMSLRNYGLAMTSAVLTVIPCVTPCCLLGQAAGIWALVVLMNNDVRAAFR
jgi:hypothetical protein